MRVLLTIVLTSSIIMNAGAKSPQSPGANARPQQNATQQKQGEGKTLPSPTVVPFPIATPTPDPNPTPQKDSTKNESANWDKYWDWFWPPIWSNWALVIAAIVAAKVAYKNLYAIEKHADIANRPWVFVTVKDGLKEWWDSAGQHVGFNWSFTNKGNMPAIIVGMNAKLSAIPRPEGVSFVDLKSHTFDFGLVDGAFAEDSCIVAKDDPIDCQHGELIPFWTETERQAVFSRNTILVGYGIVQYRYALEDGVIHETRFIAKYHGGEAEFMNGVFERIWNIREYSRHT